MKLQIVIASMLFLLAIDAKAVVKRESSRSVDADSFEVSGSQESARTQYQDSSGNSDEYDDDDDEDNKWYQRLDFVDDLNADMNSGVTLRQCLNEIKKSGSYTYDEVKKLIETGRILQKLAEKKYLGNADVKNVRTNLSITNQLINSSSELSACSNIAFQGDILLTVDQMKKAVEAAIAYVGLNRTELNSMGVHVDSFSEQRTKRSLTANSSQLWSSMPITYRIGTGVSKNLVQAAIKEWVDNTCVAFKYSSASLRRLRGNFISFTKGDGCYSNVGKKTKKEGQVITLSTRCMKKYTVVHEIGHALGLWHQQARPDRDNKIQVNADNISKKYLGQFLPQKNVKDYGVPYDHGSIMHYASTDYAKKKNQITIEAKDSSNQLTMGQRSSLSFNDVKTINKAYCSSSCKKKLNCQHNGYTDPKDCTKCRCPDGFRGKKCQNIPTSDTKCGQEELTAGNSWTSVSVSGAANCYWRIKAATTKKVKVQIESMNFACFRTCVAYVEIKTGKNFGTTGYRFCCSKPTAAFTSAAQEALVMYNGKDSAELTFKYKKA